MLQMIEGKAKTWALFSQGALAGALCAGIAGASVLYLLNVTGVMLVSFVNAPGIHGLIQWTYENLRLSIIPFSLTALFYSWMLLRLRRLLGNGGTLQKVMQADHMIDISINLFFGIGVIWTAVGMRSALIESLGGLNSESAVALGAFSILRNLVDGGILLVLSTTIFGGVGGYAMRLVKAIAVGALLQGYYSSLQETRANEARDILKAIQRDLSEVVEHKGEKAVSNGL